MLNSIVRFFVEQRVLALALAALLVVAGLIVAPFESSGLRSSLGLPHHPIPVDALPDLGENQQIVFTEWPGRSPRDVEDQVTYPLTIALQGVPGVRTVRSFSYFGFSTIYVVFDEDVDFYWSRSRILERLASLGPEALPEGVRPSLGPDATPLGQVFWYTLEGRDPDGNPTGGWDLEELRRIQDWTVRYALGGARGVSEVASIGGYQREYQVDVDPDALVGKGVTLGDVLRAVAASNLEVGARVVELNDVEYLVRGVGWIENQAQLEDAVVMAVDGVPLRVRDVATVSLGPKLRRGALDKGGVEAVGGVVVAQYGARPLEVLDNVHAKLAELAPSLPTKVLADGTLSQVTVVPFYDRSALIGETLATLEDAITGELLVTLLVVLFMLWNLGASLLVSLVLPIAVLFAFVCMQLFGVDANVVALSGIAIAIGTIVDMGIVLTENILAALEREAESAAPRPRRVVILEAALEVTSAIVTAVATTVISFLPVFYMTGAEGKLFQPLAFTKTFTLIGSIVVAILLVPALATIVFGARPAWLARLTERTPRSARSGLRAVVFVALLVWATTLVAAHWEPMGAGREGANLAFTAVLLFGVLLGFRLFLLVYEPILRWCLGHKVVFLALPTLLVLFGLSAWLGFGAVLAPVDRAWTAVGLPSLSEARWARSLDAAFPGLEAEFMPPLDEGSFLYMPSALPHASMGASLEVVRAVDLAIESIPEVESAVGKIGRVESALDPAPVPMVETIVAYRPEYRSDAEGRRLTFAYEDGAFVRDASGALVPDPDGRPFRDWRPEIQSPQDIWDEIVRRADLAGVVTAPKLQPIETRLVMLQSGMRAPLGIKVRGPSLEALETAGAVLEEAVADLDVVAPGTTFADRVVGKPYLEVHVDRAAAARLGASLVDVQRVIDVALGGRRATTTIEGRERFDVRVRYPRERRSTPDEVLDALVATASGAQVPLRQLAEVRFSRGPGVIKTEDTQLTSYVIFDKRPGVTEVEAVQAVRAALDERRAAGELELPTGVTYAFAGTFENQVRAARTLRLVLPLTLLLILVILYLQFRAWTTTLVVFSGVFVAWAGGFLMLWAYGQPGFLDVDVFGVPLDGLFGVGPISLSVAVWVGFLALFGIATDDGVVIATYLHQEVERGRPATRAELREAVVRAGLRRARPCLMTSATTLLALLPVLSSTGRGADIMLAMAIPSFGGMAVVLLSMFVVPTLFAALRERRLPAG